MRTYEDYKKEVYEDACAYIDANLGYLDYEDDLYYELINSDSVTGNSSGSYFCNSSMAQEACSDLAKESCLGIVFDEDFYNSYQSHFGDTDNIADYLRRGPEVFDVVIRCTALDDVYGDVIDYYYKEVTAREGAKSDGN